MKLWPLIALFLVGCNQRTPLPEAPPVNDSVVCLISTDSLILLAEKSIELLNRKRGEHFTAVDSMGAVIAKNSRLSKAEKADILENIKDIETRCGECYEHLKELQKPRPVAARDSIVYNITVKDSIIKKTVILYDTIREAVIIKDKRTKKRKR